jgi:hypothetical protein
MKNLEPGEYLLIVAPPAPPKKDKNTGKPYYTMAEYPGLLAEKQVVVKQGYMQRVDIKLDIPSHSKLNICLAPLLFTNLTFDIII